MIRIYQHPDCLLHDPGTGHPESAGRLESVLQALKGPVFDPLLDWQEAPLGTLAQVLLAHSAEMLAHVQKSAPTRGRISLDPDTHMNPDSLNAALRAVGAACQAVDDLHSGTATEVFCLTRPPGHHATPTHAMGFCIFNQIAIAALHARQKHGVQRIAIVDFDVHHGNGTQDCVEGNTDLFYISTHQSPYYPGTGWAEENRDFNILNLPLPSGTDDATCRTIFSTEIVPALDAFKPELLLVSAGFDAHQLDPLASLRLTEATYAWLGTTLREVAARHCKSRMLSVLEGGYNLQVLGSSVAAYLSGSAK